MLRDPTAIMANSKSKQLSGIVRDRVGTVGRFASGYLLASSREYVALI